MGNKHGSYTEGAGEAGSIGSRSRSWSFHGASGKRRGSKWTDEWKEEEEVIRGRSSSLSETRRPTRKSNAGVMATLALGTGTPIHDSRTECRSQSTGKGKSTAWEETDNLQTRNISGKKAVTLGTKNDKNCRRELFSDVDKKHSKKNTKTEEIQKLDSSPRSRLKSRSDSMEEPEQEHSVIDSVSKSKSQNTKSSILENMKSKNQINKSSHNPSLSTSPRAPVTTGEVISVCRPSTSQAKSTSSTAVPSSTTSSASSSSPVVTHTIQNTKYANNKPFTSFSDERKVSSVKLGKEISVEVHEEVVLRPKKSPIRSLQSQRPFSVGSVKRQSLDFSDKYATLEKGQEITHNSNARKLENRRSLDMSALPGYQQFISNLKQPGLSVLLENIPLRQSCERLQTIDSHPNSPNKYNEEMRNANILKEKQEKNINESKNKTEQISNNTKAADAVLNVTQTTATTDSGYNTGNSCISSDHPLSLSSSFSSNTVTVSSPTDNQISIPEPENIFIGYFPSSSISSKKTSPVAKNKSHVFDNRPDTDNKYKVRDVNSSFSKLPQLDDFRTESEISNLEIEKSTVSIHSTGKNTETKSAVTITVNTGMLPAQQSYNTGNLEINQPLAQVTNWADERHSGKISLDSREERKLIPEMDGLSLDNERTQQAKRDVQQVQNNSNHSNKQNVGLDLMELGGCSERRNSSVNYASGNCGNNAMSDRGNSHRRHLTSSSRIPTKTSKVTETRLSSCHESDEDRTVFDIELDSQNLSPNALAVCNSGTLEIRGLDREQSWKHDGFSKLENVWVPRDDVQNQTTCNIPDSDLNYDSTYYSNFSQSKLNQVSNKNAKHSLYLVENDSVIRSNNSLKQEFSCNEVVSDKHPILSKSDQLHSNLINMGNTKDKFNKARSCVKEKLEKRESLPVNNSNRTGTLQVRNPGYETDSLERNPESSASRIRQVSQTLYGDKLAGPWKLSNRLSAGSKQNPPPPTSSKITTLTKDLSVSDNSIGELSRRRGAACLFRDLSLSENSLLDTLDDDFTPSDPSTDFAAKVNSIYSQGEKSLSLADFSYPLDVAKSYTAGGFLSHRAHGLNTTSLDKSKSQIDLLDTSASAEMLDSGIVENDQSDSKMWDDDVEMRPRTNSATFVELNSRTRARIAMGMTSARLRRSYASPNKTTTTENAHIYAVVNKSPRTKAHSEVKSRATSNVQPHSSSPILMKETKHILIHSNQANKNFETEADYLSSRYTDNIQSDNPPEPRLVHSQSIDIPKQATRQPHSENISSFRHSHSTEFSGSPGNRSSFNIPRQRFSLDSSQQYLSQSAGISDNLLPQSFRDYTYEDGYNQRQIPSSLPLHSQIHALHAPMSRASINLAPLPEENSLGPSPFGSASNVLKFPKHTSNTVLMNSMREHTQERARYYVTPSYNHGPGIQQTFVAKPRDPMILRHLHSSQRSSSFNNLPSSSVMPYSYREGYNIPSRAPSLSQSTSASFTDIGFTRYDVSGYPQHPRDQFSSSLRDGSRFDGIGRLESVDRAWSYSMTSLVDNNQDTLSRFAENDVTAMDRRDSGDLCPACHRPFDQGKKRRLIDTCGHERCYTCMFNSDQCPICIAQAQMHRDAPRPLVDQFGYSAHRPKLKTNGQLRSNSTGQVVIAAPERPPRSFGALTFTSAPPPVPAKPKVFQPVALSPPVPRPQHSPQGNTLDTGEDSPPPPPPDVAQNDLMMRLGLLLGDKAPQPGSKGQVMLTRDFGLNSVSSLSSAEHTPDRCLSDTSPMSTLTVSSGSEMSLRTHPSTLHQGGSHEFSGDSMASLYSMPSATHNLSPQPPPVQRPHSITTSSPGAIEDLPLFGRRRSSLRQSARATLSDGKMRFTPVRPPQLQIQPLTFEVPHHEGKPAFVGRAWLFNHLETILNGQPTDGQSKGVIILGGMGTGKTAIVEQLVDHSCFGDGQTGAIHANRPQNKQSRSASNSQLTDFAALNGLGFQVVAYHLCQADNNVTCMVADMVSSLAAQLARAPQLVAYRDLLLQEPQLQNLLSLRECTQNPSLSFLKGILEPLRTLKNAGKIFSDSCLIVVDSLNEAEFHKPDYGDTVASFFCRHWNKFPSWLKLVVTVQTALQDIVTELPYPRILLDRQATTEDDYVSRDIVDYVDHRVNVSAAVRSNVAINGRLDRDLQSKFSQRLQTLSKGCFLYAKLVLDLIERGQLVPKSANYKILPINLSEVFLLHFNLKFSSVRSFERVSTILGVCLAALYPLSGEDIFLTINSGLTQRYISWEDFCQRLAILSGFLYRRKDNSYMFFHPAFREWLIRRDEADSPKFLCDLRNGHALMAFRLTRVSSPLTADKTIELGHHILKAHIYKNISRQLKYSSRDMQSYWMCLSSRSLSGALVSHRNVFSPNVKVSRLILLSGANPNTRTEYLSNAPLLCVAARQGFADMVSLLMEFGADPNLSSDTGLSPLCHAAATGHQEVMRMLCKQNARLSAQDKQGQCAAIHAVIHGQMDALAFLLQLNWPVVTSEPTRDEAITQCFTAAAATGNTLILEYLHLAYSGSRLNLVDSLLGESALTAACLHGRREAVNYLLECEADVSVTNSKSFTPLLCAAKSGRWEILETLLANSADIETPDKYGRTALMIAAGEGHLSVVNLLLDKEAQLESRDKEGLTSLCWGCLRGHMMVVDALVKRGSNIHHVDNSGRSPLHLAAFYGDANIVQYLLEHGAQMEHTDLSGMRALDRAIACRNTAVIVCFLRKGAKLGPDTWAMAAGKTDVLLLLLNKLMEDGNILYKKNRVKEASQRYQYALKKFPKESSPEEAQTFRDLRLNFLLNLSRCKRKLNELPVAIELASKALDMRPTCFEAFYARARAKRDNGQYLQAQDDLLEAVRLAPKNKELQRLLARVKDECHQQMVSCDGGATSVGEMDRISEDEDNSLALFQQPVREETAL